MSPGADAETVARAVAALAEPGLVVLTGAPGTGRSTLLRRIAAAFRGPVFTGGGLAILRTVPGLALARAVRAKLPAGDRALVAEAVRSRVRGGLLVLDDVQWADPLTVAALPDIAAHCRVVVALRTPHRIPADGERRLRDRAAIWLPVPPLDPAAAGALAQRVAPGLGPATVAEVVRRAGGVPVAVEALARRAAAHPERPLSGLDSGDKEVTYAVAEALADLTRPARTAMAALGLLGRPASPAVLGAGVAELSAAALISVDGEEVAPVSPYVAEVAAGLLDADERAGLHRRLADLTPDAEAARHLAAAGAGEEAYRRALAAADAAATTGERADLLVLACGLPGVGVPDEVRLAAAETTLAAGRPQACLRLLDAAGVPDTPVAAVLRAEAFLQAGDPLAALAALPTDSALAAASAPAERGALPGVPAGVSGGSTTGEPAGLPAAGVSGGSTTGEGGALPAPASADVVGVAGTAGDAVGVTGGGLGGVSGPAGGVRSELAASRDRVRLLATLNHDPDAAVAQARDIAAGYDDPPEHPGLRAALAAAAAAGRGTGWEYALASAAAAAGTAGDALAARWSAWLLVETLAADGRLTEAAQAARRAAEACAADLSYSWQTRFIAAELWCTALRGESLDDVVRRAVELVDRTLPVLAQAYATAAASLAEADGGLLASARSRLSAAAGGPVPVAGLLDWVAREAAWLDGQPEAAGELPRRALLPPVPLVDGLRRITARWAAYDGAAVSLLPPAGPNGLPQVMETLAAWDSPSGAGFDAAASHWHDVARREEVRCLLAHGLHEEDPALAVPPLLAAERLAESAGLVVLLGRARRALRRHAVRRETRGPRAGTDLTDRERDVLRLVAHGEPTRRIAGLLGISRETVETHIRAGMRKLGARTRTEAAALALEVLG